MSIPIDDDERDVPLSEWRSSIASLKNNKRTGGYILPNSSSMAAKNWRDSEYGRKKACPMIETSFSRCIKRWSAPFTVGKALSISNIRCFLAYCVKHQSSPWTNWFHLIDLGVYYYFMGDVVITSMVLNCRFPHKYFFKHSPLFANQLFDSLLELLAALSIRGSQQPEMEANCIEELRCKFF